MPRFAANISFLFRELPLIERVAAAADAGFGAVEILFPYDDPVPELRQALSLAGLPLILINAPPPNYTGGERGYAATPGGEERFRHDFRRALRYAEALRVPTLHVMSGPGDPGDRAARKTLAGNLSWAAAEARGRVLTIEPINRTDMEGYFLCDFDLAAGIIAEVGAPNVCLQFDAYHAQKITGDAMGVWAAHGHLARHVQIAGLPDRHEPEAGAVDYPAFFERLDVDGYDGWVSAEYHPADGTAAGLGWLDRAQGRRGRG